MPAIHQFVAGFVSGDAISNEAALFRTIFRNWGFNSEIFCEERATHKDERHHIKDISTYSRQASDNDVVLLHLSMGSGVNDVFKNIKARKAILYHNVTPPHYFELINKQTAAHLAKGLQQVAQLTDTAELNLADSRFNADELEKLGYKSVNVLPLVLDFSMLTSKIDHHLQKKLQDGRHNILFVGRCTPNKKIEDLLRVFAFYQKTIDHDARLIHVGSHAGSERYYNLLTTTVRELNIKNVIFAGSVPQPELNAYYATADAFLCMSEHEGFCIPLIESMLHQTPILAHASAAIPETLDGSGILMQERNFALAAELLHAILSDSTLREAIIKKQNQRLERYRSRNLENELRQHLKPLL
jgi:glycosyltransferase involved in cell wall biosynthesis